MTERKVLNKYYPPDYDPRKLRKVRTGVQRKWVQRVMAPFNMKCNTCGEFIYKAKKFNARRERVLDETYLGLAIWRFYIRCTRCLAEITFKTDLQNCDYAAEHGATRLFEAEKMLAAKQKAWQDKEDKDAIDPMKMLEKRTKSSREEMEELGRLEEIRNRNKGQARPDYDALLRPITKHAPDFDLAKQEEEDEEFVKALFGKGPDGQLMRRLMDENDDDDDDHDDLTEMTTTGSGFGDLQNKPGSSRVESTTKEECPNDSTEPRVGQSSVMPVISNASSEKNIKETARLGESKGGLNQKEILRSLKLRKRDSSNKPDLPDAKFAKKEASSVSKEKTSIELSGLGALADYATSSSSSDGETQESG